MMRCVLAIAVTATLAAAGDEPKLVDLVAIAEKLAVANQTKNVSQITALAKQVRNSAVSEGDREAADLLAAELSRSLKVAKRDLDTLELVVDALGLLRSKKGTSALKRIAFKDGVEEEQLASLQARALIALGRMADPKYLSGIEDQTKNRNSTVAKGAYACLEGYASAKGSTRKRVAEVLMKRLRNEYPRYSKSSGKRVSPEKRQRWSKISPSVIRSLQAVCHEPTITSVGNWEQWWRENKKSRKAWRDPKS